MSPFIFIFAIIMFTVAIYLTYSKQMHWGLLIPSIGLSIILALYANVTIPSKRTVEVPSAFQVIKEYTIKPGVNIQPFWYTTDAYPTTPIVINIDNAPGYTRTGNVIVDDIDKAGNPISKTVQYKSIALQDVDFDIIYRINANNAWVISKYIGTKDELKSRIKGFSRAVIREGMVQFVWPEYIRTEKVKVESVTKELLQIKINSLLLGKGIPPEIVNNVIYVEQVNRRNADVPKQLNNVLVAKAAAVEELSLQDTLDATAKRISNRQVELGNGITSSMEALPQNVNIKDVVSYMEAMPGITKADTFQKFFEQHGEELSKNGNFWVDMGTNRAIPVKK